MKYKWRFGLTAYCHPSEKDSVIEKLKARIKLSKTWKIAKITVRYGTNYSDFFPMAFVVQVIGDCLYRKPGFVNPNYSRVWNRIGNKKHRKIIKNAYNSIKRASKVA